MRPSIFQHHRDTAYSWHGGMWSPLYAFASSGIVEDKDALLHEILLNIGWVRSLEYGCHKGTDQVADYLALDQLRSFVENNLEPDGQGNYLAPWAVQGFCARRAA